MPLMLRLLAEKFVARLQQGILVTNLFLERIFIFTGEFFSFSKN